MENLGCHTVCLYHLPSVVPRQPSRLDLQVKLPAIANAAQPPDQADPISPTPALLLSFQDKLSWGWEADVGKHPIKKSWA